MKRNTSLIYSSILAAAISGVFAPVSHAADLLSVYRDAIGYDAQFAGARATFAGKTGSATIRLSLPSGLRRRSLFWRNKT